MTSTVYVALDCTSADEGLEMVARIQAQNTSRGYVKRILIICHDSDCESQLREKVTFPKVYVWNCNQVHIPKMYILAMFPVLRFADDSDHPQCSFVWYIDCKLEIQGNFVLDALLFHGQTDKGQHSMFGFFGYKFGGKNVDPFTMLAESSNAVEVENLHGTCFMLAGVSLDHIGKTSKPSDKMPKMIVVKGYEGPENREQDGAMMRWESWESFHGVKDMF